MRLLGGELVGEESPSWRRDDRKSNRFKAIEDMAPQEWCCTVEGVWGVCAVVGQVCAPTIPKNVGNISRLADLQHRSFPLHPPIKKKRLKIVLKTYFSCQFSIGCCTGHFEVALEKESRMFWRPNLDPVPCSTS